LRKKDQEAAKDANQGEKDANRTQGVKKGEYAEGAKDAKET